MVKSYNEYYTLSFWLQGTPKEQGIYAYFYGYSGYVTNRVVKSIDGFTKGYSDGECRFDITSDWRRVWVTWQLNSTGDLNITKIIAIGVMPGSNAQIAGIKLERGAQPSDWSPSNFDKADASHIHSRLNPTAIPLNDDLNDYITQGSFYCASNATAQTLTNCPVEEAFHLEVYRHAGVRQVLQLYPTYSVITYERNYYNNKWSNWYKVPTQSDITSLNSTITNKADKNHTHGVAKKVTTIAENRYCVQLGNIAIFSWWSGAINNPVRNNWTNLYTLPVKNKGKCVWSCNVLNQRNGTLYFKIDENSNIVQYFFDSSADAPYTPGQLVFFIE